jgi:hypothetical protein
LDKEEAMTTAEERFRRREEEAVLSKLRVEGVDISGDWAAIVECLSETVQPQRCIAIAKRLRARMLEREVDDA